MARYLVQASYTQQGLAGLIENPENRTNAISQLIEGAGGTLVSLDYAFGEFDIVVIGELPDHVSMAALSMAVAASGAVTNFRTTVLIPVADVVEAARRAGSVGYRPPGS
jgi:uncharacterized protein with GYD domain